MKELVFRLKRKVLRLYEVFLDNLLLWKYRNKPYIEYYRAVMRRNTKKNPLSAVGAVGDGVGTRQLGRLKIHGLKPENTIFDIGCGCLRGGIHLIEYLDKNNYTGNDISEDILKAAEIFLKEANLTDKNPTLYFTNNLEFDEINGKTFDYVHAQSVLTHMPPEDIEILLKNISKIMHSDTNFLATFFLSKTGDIYPSNQRRNFHYPFEWIKGVCDKNNLCASIVVDDPRYTGKQTLISINIKK